MPLEGIRKGINQLSNHLDMGESKPGLESIQQGRDRTIHNVIRRPNEEEMPRLAEYDAPNAPIQVDIDEAADTD